MDPLETERRLTRIEDAVTYGFEGVNKRLDTLNGTVAEHAKRWREYDESAIRASERKDVRQTDLTRMRQALELLNNKYVAILVFAAGGVAWRLWA